jgi:hypothetical protein
MFRAGQTAWRRGRDSNPRYPFGYAGFQDRSHQPLGHLSGCACVPDAPTTSEGFSSLYQRQISALAQEAECLGMEFHDLGEVRHEISQAVVAGIRVIFVLYVFYIELFV